MIGLARLRQVGFLHRLLADLQQLFLHLLAGGGDDFLDARRMDAAILHELFQRLSRATSRRTGSKHETTTTPGVSSMITSTPVAFSKLRMLRPSRPMTRPFMSSRGDRHRADRVIGRLLGGVALDRLQDDLPALSLASSCACSVMRWMMAPHSPRHSSSMRLSSISLACSAERLVMLQQPLALLLEDAR